MSYIGKPKVVHPKLPRTKLGLSKRDYEGVASTLCAGCGHDSITAAIIQAVFELDIEPHKLAKMSGIGCSSKTPAYFVSQSHGFNSVHGRMPSVTTGANAANRDLTYIGVSGDGDSLSIGMGQFAHVIRRNLNMCYIIENNGVYGLTKGQFSASADVGTKAKKGATNKQLPIDPVSTAIALGATFIARGFTGDPNGLAKILVEAIRHPGFAFVQALSPCPTFRPEQMEWKHHVRGFEAEATDDPMEAARRIQADDGMSTGVIYRANYPVFRPGAGDTHADDRAVGKLPSIESELRI